MPKLRALELPDCPTYVFTLLTVFGVDKFMPQIKEDEKIPHTGPQPILPTLLCHLKNLKSGK